MAGDSYALTMRVKLPKAFRFGFTGTPIDRTMQNTHRDFGPLKNGEQERYLSYYGIRRAIKDKATLEVHYVRDRVPFQVDEKALSLGFEKMCEEMELEDEEVKDFVQRQKSRWKELARDSKRIEIVLDKMLKHFLEYPNPDGFKAQLVAVDRKACALYKIALDQKIREWSKRSEYAELGLHPDWSEVIISRAQNTPDEEVRRFEYPKEKQDDLIDYFKLTPHEWEGWNKERHSEDRSKWRPPLKILIVCDRLLTGFDAPIEQVMYLDKPLRDHNLLQAIARTNRPLPSMKKRTGVVVDYFGVFANLEKALNFDESIREESLIDWGVLKATVPGEVARCMESFKGVTVADTRESLLGALRCLRELEAARVFEQNFKSLERLWEAVSPDPCLYPHRHQYNWLCGIYIAHRRRLRGSRDTHGELAAKTRELIQQNTKFVEIAESLPIFKIDANYLQQLDDLPSASDKAAALEAALTAELSEDDQGFLYRLLGERLLHIKQRKDASDEAAAKRLHELEKVAAEFLKVKQEPERLNLKRPGEHELFVVLRAHAATKDEEYIAECARRMIAHLHAHKLLSRGWSNFKGGRMNVEDSLLAESWNEFYHKLGFKPDEEHPPFLKTAIEELANATK